MNLSSLNEISIKWVNSEGHNISNDNTLVLSNVTPLLQNTVYTCTAVVTSNPMSCALPQNKTVTVTIKGVYYITFTNRLTILVTLETYVHSVKTLSQRSFLINSLLMIDCIITLNTPVGPGILPNITWYHNMNNITHNSSLIRISGTVLTSTLTIHSVQVSDAGVYHCNAGIDSNVTTNNISVCVTGMVYDI